MFLMFILLSCKGNMNPDINNNPYQAFINDMVEGSIERIKNSNNSQEIDEIISSHISLVEGAKQQAELEGINRSISAAFDFAIKRVQEFVACRISDSKEVLTQKIIEEIELKSKDALEVINKSTDPKQLADSFKKIALEFNEFRKRKSAENIDVDMLRTFADCALRDISKTFVSKRKELESINLKIDDSSRRANYFKIKAINNSYLAAINKATTIEALKDIFANILIELEIKKENLPIKGNLESSMDNSLKLVDAAFNKRRKELEAEGKIKQTDVKSSSKEKVERSKAEANKVERSKAEASKVERSKSERVSSKSISKDEHKKEELDIDFKIDANIKTRLQIMSRAMDKSIKDIQSMENFGQFNDIMKSFSKFIELKEKFKKEVRSLDRLNSKEKEHITRSIKNVFDRIELGLINAIDFSKKDLLLCFLRDSIRYSNDFGITFITRKVLQKLSNANTELEFIKLRDLFIEMMLLLVEYVPFNYYLVSSIFEEIQIEALGDAILIVLRELESQNRDYRLFLENLAGIRK